MTIEPSNHTDAWSENEKIDGPAGGHVNFEGVEQSSPLYPLTIPSDSEKDADSPVKDFGLNSDGTNPGTEYEGPGQADSGVDQQMNQLPLTDLDEDEPERDLLD